jgi:hypothetical protein
MLTQEKVLDLKVVDLDLSHSSTDLCIWPVVWIHLSLKFGVFMNDLVNSLSSPHHNPGLLELPSASLPTLPTHKLSLGAPAPYFSTFLRGQFRDILLMIFVQYLFLYSWQ